MCRECGYSLPRTVRSKEPTFRHKSQREQVGWGLMVGLVLVVLIAVGLLIIVLALMSPVGGGGYGS